MNTMNINSLIIESSECYSSVSLIDSKTRICDSLYNLIQDENYAVKGYVRFLNEFKSKLPKKVIDIIEDIIQEEKVHVGELIECLKLADPNYIKALNQSKKETE